jgi:hypothetical protein
LAQRGRRANRLRQLRRVKKDKQVIAYGEVISSPILIIVQSQRPDCFFDAAQQQRLAELMERWRLARDRGETLPFEEQSELEALVETELRASADRTDALVKPVNRR